MRRGRGQLGAATIQESDGDGITMSGPPQLYFERNFGLTSVSHEFCITNEGRRKALVWYAVPALALVTLSAVVMYYVASLTIACEAEFEQGGEALPSDQSSCIGPWRLAPFAVLALFAAALVMRRYASLVNVRIATSPGALLYAMERNSWFCLPSEALVIPYSKILNISVHKAVDPRFIDWESMIIVRYKEINNAARVLEFVCLQDAELLGRTLGKAIRPGVQVPAFLQDESYDPVDDHEE